MKKTTHLTPNSLQKNAHAYIPLAFFLLTLLLTSQPTQAQHYTITTTATTIAVVDAAGNGETLTMSQNGVDLQINAAGRTYSLNGGGAMAFPVTLPLAGIVSVVVNSAVGNDVLELGGFTVAFPALSLSGGTGDDVVQFNGDLTFAPNVHLDVNLQDDTAPVGIDAVALADNVNIILSGTGMATLKASKNIVLNSGSSIVTANGALTVEANQQAVPTSGDFKGVELLEGTLWVTGSGNLSVKGKGGDAGTNRQIGVSLAASQIQGGTGGIVSVEGRGGLGAGTRNHGVSLELSPASIASAGAAINVTGFGNGTFSANNSHGVLVGESALINAGGSAAAVTVQGTGGPGTGSYGVAVTSGGQITASSANGPLSVTGQGGGDAGNSAATCYGVYVSGTGSQIVTAGGPSQVTGTGGTGTGTRHWGVVVLSAGSISAGGLGSTTVMGTGGAGVGGEHHGVMVGTNGLITSSGGPVGVSGQGGGTGTAPNNIGILVNGGGRITAGVNGHVTVNGTGGGSAGSQNYGIQVSGSGSQITASGGHVNATGQGGGAGAASNSNYGILLDSEGQIAPSPNGNATVQGSGGTSVGTNNFGVLITGANTRITASGHISVTGVEGGGTNGLGILLLEGNGITTIGNNKNIALIANSMQLLGNVSTATGGSVTLRPHANGAGIDLGTSSDPVGGPLGLSDEELDHLNTGILHFGDANTGAITISASITRTSNTAVNFICGGAFHLNAASLLTAGGSVHANAAGGVHPSATGVDVNMGGTGTLAFAAGTGLHLALNGPTVDAQYRQLRVVGAVNLNGLNLVLSGSGSPACQTFVLVNNDGSDAVVGTFNGLSEGSTLNLFGSGFTVSITYHGGDGNDVVLNPVDNQYPSISCPGNKSMGTALNRCDATVTYATPTASDNCALAPGSPQLFSGTPSGGIFQKGISIVVWRAYDIAGNYATCSFRVIVTDMQSPTINCPNPITANTAPGVCQSAPINYPTPTASDNCTNLVSIVRTGGPVSGSYFPVGTTHIFWRAVDSTGRSATCSAKVIVADNELPALVCPTNIVQNNPAGACNSPVFYPTPAATDNCSIRSSFLLSGLASGSSFPLGTSTITWMALDDNGSSNTCQFTVTINCPSLRGTGQGMEARASEISDQEMPALAFSLAPNPATTEVLLTIEQISYAEAHVQIFDALGRPIWQQSLAPGQTQCTVEQVGEWPTGLYFVVLRAAGKTMAKQLWVE